MRMRIAAAALAAALGSAPPALAASGPAAEPVAPEGYRPVFLSCRDEGGEARLATREMVKDGTPTLLLVHPETLVASLEPRARWACRPTSDEDEGATRFVAAVRSTSSAADGPPPPGALRNVGLSTGKGEGSFVTGDLCPSPLPLDRSFLDRLARSGPHVPVSLSITGLWLRTHQADFRWLQEEARSGALAITWVNHSFYHPYLPGRPPGQNFLLLPGYDIDREILATEQLLVAHGETPSVFFRFPGLVSSPALEAAVRRHHLVTLGASAWLAIGQPPRPGAIVLVHPNGNEPFGLALFNRKLDADMLPRPFRAITEAP